MAYMIMSLKTQESATIRARALSSAEVLRASDKAFCLQACAQAQE